MSTSTGDRDAKPPTGNSPVRFYLVSENGSARFLRINETKTGHILLWVHGLNTSVPITACRMPDQVFLTQELARTRAWRGEQLETLPGRPDHFSFHQDGTFSLRHYGDDRPIYTDTLYAIDPVRVAPDLPRALDVEVLSDRVSYYTVFGPTKATSAAITTRPEHFVRLRCCVSGIDFDLPSVLEWDVRDDDPMQGHARCRSSKIIYKYWLDALLPEQYATRPRGTIIRLRFHTTEGRHVIKEFLFA